MDKHGKLNPDESAKNIYTGTNYSKDYLCANSPDKVPDGFISAGNSNWLGPFCHVNTWKTGFGWGGGQCTGGIGGNSGNGGNGGGSGTSSGTNSGVTTGAKCKGGTGICLTAGNADDCKKLKPIRHSVGYNEPECSNFPCCV